MREAGRLLGREREKLQVRGGGMLAVYMPVSKRLTNMFILNADFVSNLPAWQTGNLKAGIWVMQQCIPFFSVM